MEEPTRRTELIVAKKLFSGLLSQKQRGGQALRFPLEKKGEMKCERKRVREILTCVTFTQSSHKPRATQDTRRNTLHRRDCKT